MTLRGPGTHRGTYSGDRIEASLAGRTVQCRKTLTFSVSSASRLEVSRPTTISTGTPRRDARKQLEKAVADLGADGVLADQMTLHLGERECPAQEGTHDHVAEAAMLGTAVVSFDRSREAGGGPPLTIMHVNPAPAAPGRPRPDDAAQGWAQPEPEGRFLDRVSSAWSARRAARSIVSGADPAGVTRKSD
jgi:hypothetical protein